MLRRSYGSAGGQEVRIGVATTIQPRRTKMTSLDHTDTPASVDYATVYVAFELSKAKWMLGVILPGSKGLLHGQGVRDAFPLKPGFVESLENVRTGDGHVLPPGLKEEIVYEHERLSLVNKHLALLEAKSKAERRAAVPGSAEAKIVQLAILKGIGPVGGQRLVHEVFYRDFDNRRQVGSYIGLTGTPYNSGNSVREQGI